MMNDILSDRIERFILGQLAKQEAQTLVLKRKEVAAMLECAPSQVTYVINTRFSPDRRFSVESRRGSNGFIRIAIRETEPDVSGKAPDHASAAGWQGKTLEEQLDRYYGMLVSSGNITMRELLFIRELIRLFLSHCPDDKKVTAAKEAVARVSQIIKEGK